MASAGERGAASGEFRQRSTAAGKRAGPEQEDASRYCPVCFERLESRRCKMVCNVCGYFMSCADYY